MEGGLSNLPILYEEGTDIIKKKLLYPDLMPEIRAAKLGDSSGVFGAALLPLVM